MEIALIIQAIQAAIVAAPKVAEIVKAGKDMIAALFIAGKISKAQQDALMLWADGVTAMANAGIVPPGWEVRPNPVA